MIEGIDPNLKVEVAAQDSDLVAFYELRMLRDSDAVSDERLYDIARYGEDQLAHETRQLYGLSDAEYRRAVAICLSGISGVATGKDFFNDRA